MKPQRPTFTIGDTVLVRATAHRVKPFEERVPMPEPVAPEDLYYTMRRTITTPQDDGYRCWVSCKMDDPLRIGVITGLTTKQDGWYSPGYGGGWESDPEPPTWTCVRVHRLWQVKFHLRGPEVLAFEEALTYCPVELSWRLPWHTGQQWTTDEYSLRAKASLREEMTAWPRDARGRWLKKGPHGATNAPTTDRP